MTELQIEYFLEVAKHMSFSETAATKYVSQAAVSRQVAALEEELGLKLFERKYRRLSLTVAGEIFQELFIRHLQERREALTEARKRQQADSITLRVGFLEGIDMDEIFKKIMDFRKENPRHDISLSIDNIPSLMKGLNNGDYDVVFSFHPDLSVNKYIDSYPVMTTQFMFIIGADHPLAHKEQLSVEDFQNETFAAPINDSEFVRREYTHRIFPVLGYTPKELLCMDNLESVLVEVRYNNCVAMIYDKTLLAHQEDFVYIPTQRNNHVSLLKLRENKNPLIPMLFRHLNVQDKV